MLDRTSKVFRAMAVEVDSSGVCNFAEDRGVRCNDGCAARHRLEKRKAEALIERWEDETSGKVIKDAEVVVIGMRYQA